MPKSTTKRILSGKQRSLYEAAARAILRVRESALTPPEAGYYRTLLEEAGNPTNTTDRLAIIDRAKAHVANWLAEKEANKTAEQHRRELWGS